MEINLTWESSDIYEVPKSNPINQSLCDCNISLQNDEDFLLYEKKDNNTLEIIKNDEFPKEKNINILIKPTDSAIKCINDLLKIGSEKEKKFLELKNELSNLYSQINLDQNSITKKMINLLTAENEYYFKLLNMIIDKLLDFEESKKEIKIIEGNLLKYKSSKLFTLYYKLYMIRMNDSIEYFLKKANIFTSSEKNLEIFINSYEECLKFVISKANKTIKEKISSNNIYKSHIKEYEEIFSFIEKIFFLFPSLKYFDTKTQKVVYSTFDNPKLISMNENIFNEIKQINYQIPKKDGLKIPFSIYEENLKKTKQFEMSFKRILDSYKKYKALYFTFIYASLLYDN